MIFKIDYSNRLFKYIFQIYYEDHETWNRQLGWIGTDGVNQDSRLEPGETQRQNVTPVLSPESRFTPVDGRLTK